MVIPELAEEEHALRGVLALIKLFIFCDFLTSVEHDMILGKSWLSKENPDIDWVRNIIRLSSSPPMTLLGVEHHSPNFLISSMQLKKAMNKRQVDQVFFVPVQSLPNRITSDKDKIDPKIKKLTSQLEDEYRDVFPDELPKQLPPSREFDHRIEHPLHALLTVSAYSNRMNSKNNS